MSSTNPSSTNPHTPRPGYGQAKAELIEATIRVVAAKGYRGLSHRAIAAEAGVAHGLVRHHFGSIAGLVSATLEAILPRTLSVNPITPLLAQEPDAEDTILNWLDGQVDEEVLEYEILLASRHVPELEPVVHDLYRVYEQTIIEGFVSAGYQSPTPGQITVLLAALEGLVFHRVTLYRSNDETMRQAIEAFGVLLRSMATAG